LDYEGGIDIRLSQMILDQVFSGVLNEAEGTLEVYDEHVEDVSLTMSLYYGACGAES
jgi:hypothetical protein